MADKNWTAVDITLSRCICTVHGSLYDSSGSAQLSIKTRYNFVNENGDELSGLSPCELYVFDTIGNLPINLLEALQTVDAYLYQLALEKEGMA